MCDLCDRVFLVQNQTQKLIEPINQINLEKPLDNVCYEELRPLLFRLDQQNRQIKKQLEDLKNAESARKEFTANVSHELKKNAVNVHFRICGAYDEWNGTAGQDAGFFRQDFS